MSPADLFIRDATPADALRCSRINLNGWLTAYKDIIAAKSLSNLSEEELLKKWSWRLQHPDAGSFCLVGEVHKEVIGYIMAGPNRNTKFPAQYEVTAFYLEAAYRRKGIGRQLFTETVTRMKELNVPSFHVFVLSENLPARNFYTSFLPDDTLTATVVIDGIAYPELCLSWSNLSRFGI